MKTKNRKGIICIVFITIFVMNTGSMSFTTTEAIEPYFTLVCKTVHGVRADYCNLLKQQLAEIGINLDVIIIDWPSIVAEMLSYHDYDILPVGLVGNEYFPDYTGVYNENGSLNIFGYTTDMDYNETLGTGINEWYITQGAKMLPSYSEQTLQHYWDWQQHLMNNILPCYPSLVSRSYEATWSNLEGYNMSNGLVQSWGKLLWNGVHDGQLNTDEIVIAAYCREDLNPIYQTDYSSNMVNSAILDSLFYFDSDCSMWPHLATGYSRLNENTLRINLREGIKWQPDRDNNFTDEYFDAEDVYFTYSLGSLIDWYAFQWLTDLAIVDDYTIDFTINFENCPYTMNSILKNFLSSPILPEHYLNQTQNEITNLPDRSHQSWQIYSEHCFGTGLFTLTQYQENEDTILTIDTDSWWLNTTITNDPLLDWQNRMGNFQNNPSQLRIRTITNPLIKTSEFFEGRIDSGVRNEH